MHAQIEQAMTRQLFRLARKVQVYGITHANPYNAAIVWRYRHFACPTPCVNSRFTHIRLFFSCSDWAVFAVIQQMDALKAQE
jgi:hypothetical protein